LEHASGFLCKSLASSFGGVVDWNSTGSCRYLGVYFVSGRIFKCYFDHAKSQFFRSFNAKFSKIGRFASEEVVISLIHAKCLPVLLYGREACHILVRDKRSLEFTVSPSMMKLFRTSSANTVEDCQKIFHSLPISYLSDRYMKIMNGQIFKKCCLNQIFLKIFVQASNTRDDKEYKCYDNVINDKDYVGFKKATKTKNNREIRAINDICCIMLHA